MYAVIRRVFVWSVEAKEYSALTVRHAGAGMITAFFF